MSQTERLYRLKNWLDAGRCLGKDFVLRELGVSPATLKRDLAHLRDRMNAPVVFDRERQGWRLDFGDRSVHDVLGNGGVGFLRLLLALGLLQLARRGAAPKTAPVSSIFRNTLTGLTVCLSDSIHLAARRSGIEKFDALIVDEGQDILNMESLSKLDMHLKGGVHQGRWCFFHDVNNQSGLCGSYAPDAYEYLSSFTPTKIPLRTNCRNSLPILKRIQDALCADMGNSGVGNGPAVREVFVGSPRAAVQSLEEELETLLEKERFNPGDIVILSRLPFEESCIASLPLHWRKSISILDGASPLSSNRQSIGFARIPDFKGLESKVVVLIDLPAPGSSDDLRSLHYVGMSRARAVLSMITDNTLEHSLQC